LIIVVEDGDDLHAELHAPYPHSRDVAAIRSSLERTSLLFVSASRSCEVQTWVERGWVTPIEHSADARRNVGVRFQASADSTFEVMRDEQASARIPKLAFETIRDGLERGPVLVQVARAGYIPLLACAKCHAHVRCEKCAGTYAMSAERVLTCEWCGHVRKDWRCGACDGTALRASVIGVTRTAEELGKACANFPMIDSSGEHVVSEIGDERVLVVATQGAEPNARYGYAAAVMLDADRILNRPELRSAEEALRRWLKIATQVRVNGKFLVVGDANHAAIQALIRCDPVGFASRELRERTQAHLPPAWAVAEVLGEPNSVRNFAGLMQLPQSGEALGPVNVGQEERLIVRVPGSEINALSNAMRQAAAAVSAQNKSALYTLTINSAHFPLGLKP
jgi:primosomal protein N' (replication factor Y)